MEKLCKCYLYTIIVFWGEAFFSNNSFVCFVFSNWVLQSNICFCILCSIWICQITNTAFLVFFFLPVVVKSWSSKNQNFNTWGQETVERQVLLGWCDWGLKGWHFYILCTTFIFRCVNKKKHMETHTQTCPCYPYSMLTVWFLLSLTLQYSFKLSFKRHKHFEAGCTVFHCT